MLRGVESRGMLCSARELGLSEDHSGLLELPATAKPGADVRRLLDLDEQVLTFKLTPNRADCLSVLGIAREVSALTGAKLAAPGIKPVAAKSKAKQAVRITHAEGCGRFAGRVIRGVDAAAPTPRWMRQRLERAGQRSISALVDVTNYVMLELGRPLHVYDQDKLTGAIDVRWGHKGEKLLLLNGQEVEVDAAVLCITDDSGPIGLAGIMGGESTKAETSTQEHLSRVGVLLSRCGRRARAALQLHERRRAPLRARRGFRQQRRRHRARHAADPRDLRRRARPDGGPGEAPAEAKAGALARGARAEGDRHPGDGQGSRQRVQAPRPAIPPQGGRASR